jgi:PAS domain S-box-containing protein
VSLFVFANGGITVASRTHYQDSDVTKQLEFLREDLEREREKVKLISVLHEIGSSVVSSMELEKAFTYIVDTAFLVSNAEEGALMLLDEQTDELRMRAPKGLWKVDRDLGANVKDSIAREVLRTGKSQRLTNGERVIKVMTDRAMNSALYVPVKVKEKAVGTLYVGNRTYDRPFTEDDENALSILAGHAATAISNARQTRILSSLQDTSRSILSVLDLDRVLGQIAEGALEVLEADTVTLYEYDKRTDDVIVPPVVRGELRRPEVLGARGHIHKRSVVFNVIRRGQPFYARNARSDWAEAGLLDWPAETEGEPYAIREGIASSAGVPLIAANEIIGVMFVNYRTPHEFPAEAREIIETFVNQAAIAIQNARLFETVQRNAEELSALYNVSLDITRQLEVKPLLETIVQRAADLLRANGGGFLLRHPKREEIEMVVAHKLPVLLGMQFEFGQGLVGRVAQSGEPMIENDYHTWEDRDRRFDEEPYDCLFRAVVGVPLKQENEVIGVLAVSDTDKGRVFGDSDVRLLERFAAQAAVAIGNARTVLRLGKLVSSSPNAIIAVDRKGRITDFNEASKRIMGYTQEEMLGEFVAPFYYDGLEEAKTINGMLIEADKKGHPVGNYETFVRGKDGEKIPIDFSGALLRDAYGTRIGSIGIITDLRELRLLEQRYHALFEVGKVAVEIPDSDMRGICQEIIDVMTGKVHHFKASHLHLVNEDGDLEIMAGGGAAERYEEAELILKRGEGVTSKVLGAKQCLYVTNVQREKKFKYRDWARGNDVHSYLGVPLTRVEGEVIGVIAVYTGEEYEFSKEEIQFLERFASLAALVIDKAKEVDRSRKIAEALWQVTPDAVVLSGEDIGDLWAGVDRTIARMMPNTNLCLYVCDYVDRSIATRRESNSEILSSRLKSSWHRGDSPFISGVNVDSEAYLILGCHSAQGQLEGFLLLERTPTTDGVVERFDEIDRVILTTLASAVGSALFHQRRQIHIQSALNDAERSGQ